MQPTLPTGRRAHRWSIALATAGLLACTAEPPPDPGADGGDPGDGGGPAAADDADAGCPEIYRAAVLPDYHVTISAGEWAALWDEFIAYDDSKPYHPIRFRWQDSREVDARIRLKGQWSWVEAIQLDDPPKMQFVISFNEDDPQGRFMGQRKIELDMPRVDRSFLRQRLALSALRELGMPAQCANSARLFINGEYYGLYTATERMDKEFIERVFPGADAGDLWDAGYKPRTNDTTYDAARIDAFWRARSAAELAAVADLNQAVREWAAEAVINNADGAYGGNHNFYLYDHPSQGYLWLPHDVDATFNLRPASQGPIYPTRDEQPSAHYLMVMDDPGWRQLYLKALRDTASRLDVMRLEDRVDRWAEQIARAAADDPNKPFTTEQHTDAIERLRGSILLRVEYLAGWFDCLDEGGVDADGDGHDACNDCDDADGAARPGAPETCNHLDDDCDGRVDEEVSVKIQGDMCPPQ